MFPTIRHAAIRAWELTHRSDTLTSDESVDFWLVCHSKDFSTAKITIESILKFSLNKPQNLYLVLNEKRRPDWLGSEYNYINENDIPATAQIHKELKDVPYKGWVLQQALKYSGSLFSERFVVLDCDTVLLRPHLFFKNDATVLRLAYEHSPHYRKFEQALNINAKRYLSFTCHMMPYRSRVLNNLFQHIQDVTGLPWISFIALFAKTHGMVVNEQDLYARFLIQTSEPYQFNPWLNKTVPFYNDVSFEKLVTEYSSSRNSVSLHQNSDKKLVIF